MLAEIATQSNSIDAARQAALDWLLGRINYERSLVVPYNQRQLKLDRMRQLLTRLGQPDAGIKIVHVAGTKGKGSTSAMIASMLSAAGYRTGLFSSPHLERIEERFSVDGNPCTAMELVNLVNRMQPVVRAMDEEAIAEGDPTGGPTYFEVTTAMALVHFVECQVDAAILEVGLGGRLDSTNVCLPAVSVITSISLDHTQQLGTTLAAIAKEKAGIIKPGVPVVCGVTNDEPQNVIADVAREYGARLIRAGVNYQFRYPASGGAGSFDYESCLLGQELQLSNIRLGMLGSHQAANAAVALTTVLELRHQGWCISTEAMRFGLSRAVLPGRVEVLRGRPTVVIDTAHNAASAKALVSALGELSTPSRRTLILSISHDKDVPAIVGELVPHFERIVVTQYQENPRAVPVKQLLDLVEHAAGKLPVKAQPAICVFQTPQEAWHYTLESHLVDELICMAGSFYLAAEMQALARHYATSAAAER